MKQCSLYLLAALASFHVMQPAVCRADTLTIAYLSYDASIPSGTGTAVDNFDLYNLTGPTNVPGSPDVITDSEVFSGSLALTTSAGAMSYTFSGVDVNGANATLASLAANVSVYNAVLTLMLSNSTGVGSDDAMGHPATVNLQTVPNLTLSVVPPGTSLVACDSTGSPCAATVITVDTAVSSAVTPEPETMWLVLTGIGGVAAFRSRFRSAFRKSARNE